MAETVPELKEVVGALVFSSARALSVREIRRCLDEVAGKDGAGGVYGKLKESDVTAVVRDLMTDLAERKAGIGLCEVAGGFRFQSDAACGRWVRHLLEAGRPSRLSQPALETLAIVAYRQPVTRTQIEAVRGVSVDHVIKSLMELQLVRIVGRSSLPGRPFLYGTTHAFLEHFGLRNLAQLEELNPALKQAAELAEHSEDE